MVTYYDMFMALRQVAALLAPTQKIEVVRLVLWYN